MAAVLALLPLLIAGAAAHDWVETDWGAYYYPTISCPSHPHTLCDFYFDGHENDVPTFYLDDGVVGDHPLIPTPRSTLNWFGSMDNFAPGVKSYLTDNWVLANSRNGTFLPYPDGTYDSSEALETFDQFYLNAKTDAISHIYARSWQIDNPAFHQHSRCFWEKKCIYLPFSGAWIQGTPINLGKNDNYTETYPPTRRCVVFKTAQ